MDTLRNGNKKVTPRYHHGITYSDSVRDFMYKLANPTHNSASWVYIYY